MNSTEKNSGRNAVSNSSNQIETASWGLAYAVVGIITILGNSLTIAVFVKKKFQRKKLHYILINLAVTDLTVGAISVPMQIHAFVADQLSESVLDAHYFLDVLTGLTSMYSIAFISVERLIAVCWPFKHRILKLWHYVLVISLTWLSAGTVALVSNQVLPRRISQMEGLNVRTVFAVIPIVVTIAAYYLLWHMRKGRIYRAKRGEDNEGYKSTLLILTIVFLCTWSPFIILTSTVEYATFPHLSQCCSLTMNGYILALHFTKLLQYSNSCVNPFIYALRIQSFRDTTSEILCCCKNQKIYFTSSRETDKNRSSCAGDTEMRTVRGINEGTNCKNETSQSEVLAADQQL